MSGTDNIALLKLSLYKSFENNTLIKAVLSKKRSQASDLNNVFIRPVVIKGTAMLSFVYRHATNDVTRNLSSGQASNEIDRLLTEHFLNADIFTSEA
ncbi:MAG: hypothetical protein PHX54_07635, partial [Lentimicrobiaceae bacterium]|nr:hypothetical protein [Lentimicrobiaceae bacterium]